MILSHDDGTFLARQLHAKTHTLLVYRVINPVHCLPHAPAAARDDARGRTSDHDAAHDRDPCGRVRDVSETATAELVAVTPRGDLGTQRAADAHQLETLRQARQPDVVCRHAQARRCEPALAVLDCFPAFFERREVPALALLANDPQSALRRVKRQTSTDGERLDDLVRAEVFVTE